MFSKIRALFWQSTVDASLSRLRDEMLGVDDDSEDYNEKCRDVYREGVEVRYRRERMEDLSNASSKLTETKMKALHVDDYRDYARSRSQASTLFNLLAIEESKVGNIMNDGKNALKDKDVVGAWKALTDFYVKSAGSNRVAYLLAISSRVNVSDDARSFVWRSNKFNETR